MANDLKDSQKSAKGQWSDKTLRSQEALDTLAGPNERRQLAIRSLLETLPNGINEKLTTVKAAHYVDKARFQSAFRSLMGANKT